MSGDSIEDRISAHLGLSNDDASTTESGNDATTTAPINSENTEHQTEQQGDTEQREPRAEQRPQQDNRTQHNQQRQDQTPRGRLPANQQGDLVDPNTGSVVARAGNERRYYEAARNAHNQVQTLQREVERLNGQVQAHSTMQSLPQQHGLSNDEHMVAVKFMSEWKRSPVEAAKNMLAELRAMGHDVEGLGSTVDMAAIQRMMQNTIAPFQNDREAQVREQQYMQNAEREMADAAQRFPWFNAQQEALAQLLNADQTLTLREAGYMLQSWAAQRGIDLMRPISQQAATARQAAKQNAARQPAPTGSSDLTPRRAGAVRHDVRNKDIVLEAMREHGFNINNL